MRKQKAGALATVDDSTTPARTKRVYKKRKPKQKATKKVTMDDVFNNLITGLQSVKGTTFVPSEIARKASAFNKLLNS